jgi:hypothetical protein
MKLSTYKVKAILTREGKEVNLSMDEDNKQLVGSEPLAGQDLRNLPNLSASISEENEKAKLTAKSTLFPTETEGSVMLDIKYIEQ